MVLILYDPDRGLRKSENSKNVACHSKWPATFFLPLTLLKPQAGGTMLDCQCYETIALKEAFCYIIRYGGVMVSTWK